jgi:hypothetical protein
MFLRMKIILISIIFLIFSSVANAQVSTSTNAKFTFLNEGDLAPFAGALFSIEATAQLLADKEKSEKKCELDKRFILEKQKLKCKRDLDLSESILKIETKKYNTIISAQDEQISRLKNIATKTNDYSLLWFSGGVLLGIATSIGIFFAATEISKR